jgi:hypothetical protein
MEFISLSHIKNNMIRQYGKQKALKGKINNYFTSFIDRHPDLEYGWLEHKVYLKGDFAWKLKKELEKTLNKPVRAIQYKYLPADFVMPFFTQLEIKAKVKEYEQLKKDRIEAKKQKFKDDFFSTIKSIKEEKENSRYIGAFDLEFWEHNTDLILEFGWSIVDYKGETHSVHILVQENLDYENGTYTKNNRYARTDTVTMPLKLALERFQKDFLDKTDIIVGHGLESDLKVLDINGFTFDREYLDTSDIGGAIMDEEDKVSLTRLLEHLNIDAFNLHNAANDAEYVLDVFFEMGDL